MPDMDGYETIKIMRERGYVLPVVALTAHAMQSDKQRCLDAGMDAYLSKPFKQALLFDTIHSPVSYTHLDVYKRQAMKSARRCTASFPLPN